ncbi:MAG: DUF885 domain-containing protein [Longimicrobiales bacterium]
MPTQVTALADRYIEAYFNAFPHQATLVGRAAGPHDRLPDISAEARARWEAAEDSLLTRLEALDTTKLTAGSAQAVTYGFLRAVLRNARDYRVCHIELWNVSPTWTGWPQELALLANSQPLGTAEQNEAAYKRFSELPRYLDQEMANLRAGLERGYSAPHNNVRAVIQQVDALLKAQLAESPFVSMAPDSLRDLRPRLEQLETVQIRPAIQRYRDFLQAEYLPRARNEVGVSANPEGASCYRAAVRYHATVDMSAEDIHRTGLEQMARIQSEMQKIAQRSFGTDNVDTVLKRLKTDRKYLLSSRDEMMKVAQGAVDRARAAVPKVFGNLPSAHVMVEPVAAFSEASAPGGFYSNPSEDGNRPGVYYINLRGAESKPRAGQESTAFHETYPGHHLQGALALERKELHPMARYLYQSGFGEGWGLYSERLAEELGLFSSDVDRMGLLSNEALRAARLVVDAGMHALGWPRPRAIDYMLANTAESPDDVVSEIDRYIAVPGQATSYMLGNLEIRRLREQAQQQLGARFDLRAFHDQVLEDGAVPLSLLSEKIGRWVVGATNNGSRQ